MYRLDVLNDAFDELTQEPTAEEPAPEPAPETEPLEAEATPEPESEDKPDRARDESGRFAKAVEEKPAPKAKPVPAPKTEKVAPLEQKPAAPVAAPPAPAPVKAPQSWKPAAREAFAKAPPEVQQEALRREAEVTRVLNETADARRTVESVQRALAPYESIARANGMDAMSYTGSVLQTAAVLQMGTPQQKAQAFATLLHQFQPDLDAINALLQGQQPQHQPQQAQPVDVNRLVNEALEQRFGMAQQQRAGQDWEAFQATQPEFLGDVKADMIEVLELASKQGRNLTYQQAYDRACKLNDDVSSIIGQRKAAEAARTKQQATEKAKAARSSPKSQPTAAPAAQPAGRRAVLEAAYDDRES